MNRHHFRILQNDMTVAGGCAPDRERMLREMDHYAALYTQEGTITIQTRSGKGRWKVHLP